MQAVFPPAAQEGFRKVFAAYGALVEEIAFETVNGFPYMSVRPAVGSPESSGPPPKLVFKLLTKVHPTMRRRMSRMRETFEIKRWRRDAEKWDEEWKPERIEANRALQSVELVFSVGILSIMGAAVFTGAEQVVELFTRDPTTIGYAIDFTRAFAVSMLSVGVFYPLAGSLVGAGDTRTPMYARFVGVVIFLLAGSFLLGVTLDLGLVGVYVGVVFSFVSWALIVAAGFQWGGWQELAERMIEERSDA
jgi:hypothetical protein